MCYSGLSMKKIEKILEKLPDQPGIYLYHNADGDLIYVGKATSLRQRVRSYFRGKRTPRPIEEMIHEVVDIKWKVADSVLEAVILESFHIKKFQPKYNVLGKDSKSWNYIVITSDEYPRITTVRQHDLMRQFSKNPTTAQLKKLGYAQIFGPYPGLNTKATMKLLRRLFHFSTCKPDGSRMCLYYEMGQCLGVCTGEISATEYKRQVIKPLITFLKGGKKRVISTFTRRMKTASKEQDYETAARLRNQIASLQRIHDVALLNKDFYDDPVETQNLASLRGYDLRKIEGYDISNLGATGVVGSLVVFMHGEPDKKQYRKFKIKTIDGQSDVDSLQEVFERRLKHGEWPLPDLFLIDGGLPQVNRVKKVLKEREIDIPVVGIAKGPKRKKNEFIFGSKKKDLVLWVSQHQRILVRVRDEAHRFALAYQRKLRSKR